MSTPWEQHKNQEVEKLQPSGSVYNTDDLTLGDYMQDKLVAQHSRGKEKRKRQPTHQVLHGTFVLYRRYARQPVYIYVISHTP